MLCNCAEGLHFSAFHYIIFGLCMMIFFNNYNGLYRCSERGHSLVGMTSICTCMSAPSLHSESTDLLRKCSWSKSAS